MVHRCDVLTQPIGHIFNFFGITPNLVEQAQKVGRVRRVIKPIDEVGDGVALLITQVDGGKAVQGLIDRLFIFCLNASELLHGCFATIGSENSLTLHPVSAFPSNGSLGQLVLQLNFKLTAVKAPLPLGLWDMKFPADLATAVSDFVGDECRRGENELQGFNGFELLLQFRKGVDGETGRRNLQLRTWLDTASKVVPEKVVDIINQLHGNSVALPSAFADQSSARYPGAENANYWPL